MQTIKCRDDAMPVHLVPSQSDSADHREFVLDKSSTCTWAKEGQEFGSKVLRRRIEPWLTALVQSEHLSLLVGSGLTHAVHHLATADKLPGMDCVNFASLNEEITAEARRIASISGRNEGNIEDQIRVANELIRGLEILSSTNSENVTQQATLENLRSNLAELLQSFTDSILEGEQNLITCEPAKRDLALNYLVSFLMSFSSRSGTRERLQIFTTNYDRYIEAGSDAAGLRLIDRFVGTLTPIFRASRLDVDLHYNPPGIRGEPRYLEGVARFTKLHGSVDWLDFGDSIRRVGLPFGANDSSRLLSAYAVDGLDARQFMIYPNAAKDRETAAYPYVELFRDFAASICRPNSTVVCYGYSFGDEHINRVVEDMLTIPSTHLVIIAFSDPLGRIMQTYEKLGRHAQVSILLGDHLGDLRSLVDHFLPKPAIDRTTFRMADLLRGRRGTAEGDDRRELDFSSVNDGGAA